MGFAWFARQALLIQEKKQFKNKNFQFLLDIFNAMDPKDLLSSILVKVLEALERIFCS